jgi:hypothetical protein
MKLSKTGRDYLEGQIEKIQDKLRRLERKGKEPRLSTADALLALVVLELLEDWEAYKALYGDFSSHASEQELININFWVGVKRVEVLAKIKTLEAIAKLEKMNKGKPMSRWNHLVRLDTEEAIIEVKSKIQQQDLAASAPRRMIKKRTVKPETLKGRQDGKKKK